MDIFLNGLDETGLRQILSAVDILREEIAFALSATDIPTDEAFEFFKRFSGAIHAVKDTELGYDRSSRYRVFYGPSFSGFDFVTGYRKEDVVAKMIEFDLVAFERACSENLSCQKRRGATERPRATITNSPAWSLRKDWRSVRKRACVWTSAGRKSPRGEPFAPVIASIRGSCQ